MIKRQQAVSMIDLFVFLIGIFVFVKAYESDFVNNVLGSTDGRDAFVFYFAIFIGYICYIIVKYKLANKIIFISKSFCYSLYKKLTIKDKEQGEVNSLISLNVNKYIFYAFMSVSMFLLFGIMLWTQRSFESSCRNDGIDFEVDSIVNKKVDSVFVYGTCKDYKIACMKSNVKNFSYIEVSDRRNVFCGNGGNKGEYRGDEYYSKRIEDAMGISMEKCGITAFRNSKGDIVAGYCKFDQKLKGEKLEDMIENGKSFMRGIECAESRVKELVDYVGFDELEDIAVRCGGIRG